MAAPSAAVFARPAVPRRLFACNPARNNASTHRLSVCPPDWDEHPYGCSSQSRGVWVFVPITPPLPTPHMARFRFGVVRVLRWKIYSHKTNDEPPCYGDWQVRRAAEPAAHVESSAGPDRPTGPVVRSPHKKRSQPCGGATRQHARSGTELSPRAAALDNRHDKGSTALCTKNSQTGHVLSVLSVSHH